RNDHEHVAGVQRDQSPDEAPAAGSAEVAPGAELDHPVELDQPTEEADAAERGPRPGRQGGRGWCRTIPHATGDLGVAGVKAASQRLGTADRLPKTVGGRFVAVSATCAPSTPGRRQSAWSPRSRRVKPTSGDA